MSPDFIQGLTAALDGKEVDVVTVGTWGIDSIKRNNKKRKIT